MTRFCGPVRLLPLCTAGQTILWPAKYVTGKAIYPYAEAKN